MKAILRTNDYTEDYKIVDVIKNPISENNGLALVEFDNDVYLTGGILCGINSQTISVLENMNPREQYEWLESIKRECYVW